MLNQTSFFSTVMKRKMEYSGSCFLTTAEQRIEGGREGCQWPVQSEGREMGEG